MISYLPEIYPDELVYSWFCRYYVHTGCLTHKAALNDILSNRHDNPSKEFLGHLNADMLAAIQRMYPRASFTSCIHPFIIVPHMFLTIYITYT